MNTGAPKPTSLLEKFHKKFDLYQALLEKDGQTVFRSEPAEAARLLATLTPALLDVMYRRLTIEIEIFEKMFKAGEPVRDPKRQLWRYLRLNGLTPCSDLFDKIRETDIVQVFSPQQLTIFLTSNIYKYVSFSLEQLFTLAWYEYTIREPKFEQPLARAALDTLNGKHKTTYFPGVERHLVREVNSAECREMDMYVKWISPLYADTQIAGFLGVLELTLRV